MIEAFLWIMMVVLVGHGVAALVLPPKFKRFFGRHIHFLLVLSASIVVCNIVGRIQDQQSFVIGDPPINALRALKDLGTGLCAYLAFVLSVMAHKLSVMAPVAPKTAEETEDDNGE